MPDREKVIKGLEMCINDIECTGCPYENDCFAPDDNPFGTSMMRDALALMKEQKAVKPFIQISEHTGRKWLTCGACEYPIESEKDSWEEVNFCPKCGRPVLWEGR